MELDWVMRTTPATREFTDDPLPDDVLYEILDRARFAPERRQRTVLACDRGARPCHQAAHAEPYDLGMREYMATAPVLLVITIDLDNVSAVHSGLGRGEDELRRLLAIPDEHVLATMLPLG